MIVAALTTAAGLGYLQSKLGELQRVSLGNVLTETGGGSDEPQNYLLVGVDNTEGLDPDDPIFNERDISGEPISDTIMVLHLDPREDRAALVSIPRDLWLPLISAEGEELATNKINAAIGFGGVPALVETIETNLDIPINHYLQVDFAGFRSLVETIGGVPIYFDTPVRSEQAGLAVPDPGCVTLGPEEALAYARARDYQTFEDGEWQTDFTADLGRISRQQDFVRRALEEAVASGIRNPATLNELIDVGLDSVLVDDLLSADDIFDLGRRFRSFNPETLDLFTLPTEQDFVGEADVQLLLEQEAQPILDIFRDIDPEPEAPPSPERIRVEVLNGTGVTGQAGDATQQLSAAGFPTATPGDVGTMLEATTVRHTVEQEAAAALVAQHVDGGAVLEEVPDTGAADVVLVTGADFTGVSAEPSAPSAEEPSAAEPPPEEQAAEAPPTTVVGEVPGEPPPGVECS